MYHNSAASRVLTIPPPSPSHTAPDALNNLKAKLKAVFKKKGEKKPADSKPAEATPAATSTAPAAAEPAKTETAPAPAGESYCYKDQ